MSKVFIVQVKGWGDDEDAMENVSAHSTHALAEEAAIALVQQAEADGLEDTETDIIVMSIDA